MARSVELVLSLQEVRLHESRSYWCALLRTTANRAGRTISKGRLSHQAIDGNLKRARPHVNGYVLIPAATGYVPVTCSWFRR